MPALSRAVVPGSARQVDTLVVTPSVPTTASAYGQPSAGASASLLEV